jgi:hypothetical protein
MQALFDFVMYHPFWALYLAILLGIAIHGFRSNNTVNNTARRIPGDDKSFNENGKRKTENGRALRGSSSQRR